MYVNKVGPYYNPQETYHYYSLPVCVPEKVSHQNRNILSNTFAPARQANEQMALYYMDICVYIMCNIYATFHTKSVRKIKNAFKQMSSLIKVLYALHVYN